MKYSKKATLLTKSISLLATWGREERMRPRESLTNISSTHTVVRRRKLQSQTSKTVMIKTMMTTQSMLVEEELTKGREVAKCWRKSRLMLSRNALTIKWVSKTRMLDLMRRMKDLCQKVWAFSIWSWGGRQKLRTKMIWTKPMSMSNKTKPKTMYSLREIECKTKIIESMQRTSKPFWSIRLGTAPTQC